MVSVTGSVTWISKSSSVIGTYVYPRRQRDERHAHNATGWKELPEAVRPLARCRKADATPLPGTAVKGRIPDSPTGAERGPTASETGAYDVEYRVGGEFSPHGFSAVLDNLRVEEKRSLGFPELGKPYIFRSIHNLGTISGEIKPDIG